MKREDIMKAEESFAILEQDFVIGKLLNGENVRFCWIQVQVNLICQNLII